MAPTFALSRLEMNRRKNETVMELHFPIAGLILFVGSIAFLKLFDFFAAQSAKRLLELADEGS